MGDEGTTPRAGEIKWVAPGDDSADGLRLVLDASTGQASAIDPTSGDVTTGIVLALSGRTLENVDEYDQRDYVFNSDQAMAVAGMLFAELPEPHRAQLIAHWRADGLLA